MIIDIFNHFYPIEYLDELEKVHPIIELRLAEDGRIYVYDRITGQPYAHLRREGAFVDIERRLNLMDKYNISKQVLTIGYPATNPVERVSDTKFMVKLARTCNEALSKIVEKYPDRFEGVAELPMLSTDDALEEAERAVKELGLKGFQIYTSIAGKTLDDPLFYPILEKIHRLGVPILLHPTTPTKDNVRSYELDYELWLFYGWPFETSLAISRLVFSNILDRLPGLKIVTHHLGGMIPFFAKRISELAAQKRKGGALATSKLSKPILEYFKSMYHDTAVNGYTPALKCGYELFGADHIVFGTDFPFGPDDGELTLRMVTQSIKEMGLSEEEEEKIFWRNAKNLLKIK